MSNNPWQPEQEPDACPCRLCMINRAQLYADLPDLEDVYADLPDLEDVESSDFEEPDGELETDQEPEQEPEECESYPIMWNDGSVECYIQ